MGLAERGDGECPQTEGKEHAWSWGEASEGAPGSATGVGARMAEGRGRTWVHGKTWTDDRVQTVKSSDALCREPRGPQEAGMVLWAAEYGV